MNAVRNLILAVKVLSQEKPKVLVSAGAGIAVPFFIAARLMGVRTIYIEPVDFIHQPSLTGKLVYRLVDLFLVQDKRQQKFFPKAKLWGSSLDL